MQNVYNKNLIIKIDNDGTQRNSANVNNMSIIKKSLLEDGKLAEW